jgi:hypothetical protein
MATKSLIKLAPAQQTHHCHQSIGIGIEQLLRSGGPLGLERLLTQDDDTDTDDGNDGEGYQRL